MLVGSTFPSVCSLGRKMEGVHVVFISFLEFKDKNTEIKKDSSSGESTSDENDSESNKDQNGDDRTENSASGNEASSSNASGDGEDQHARQTPRDIIDVGKEKKIKLQNLNPEVCFIFDYKSAWCRLINYYKKECFNRSLNVIKSFKCLTKIIHQSILLTLVNC